MDTESGVVWGGGEGVRVFAVSGHGERVEGVVEVVWVVGVVGVVVGGAGL